MSNRSSRRRLASRASSNESPNAGAAKPQPLFAANANYAIERLKERHGLPADFDLARKLRSIERRASDQRIQPIEKLSSVRSTAQSAEELKQFIKKVRGSVRSLHPLLEAASDVELSLLIYGSANPPKSATPTRFSHTNLLHLTDLLARLDHAAREANVGAVRGRTANRYRSYVAKGVRELYVEALGPGAPRITKGNVYSGRFFSFMSDALSFFGIRRMENKALGRLCEAAIRGVDGVPVSRPRRVNQPSANNPRK